MYREITTPVLSPLVAFHPPPPFPLRPFPTLLCSGNHPTALSVSEVRIFVCLWLNPFTFPPSPDLYYFLPLLQGCFWQGAINAFYR